MMLSMAAFVKNDTVIKLVLVELALFPAILLRGVVATILLVALAGLKRVMSPRASPGAIGC